eukprot:8930295-Heterocapsa_arctica.AAC.1
MSDRPGPVLAVVLRAALARHSCTRMPMRKHTKPTRPDVSRPTQPAQLSATTRCPPTQVQSGA